MLRFASANGLEHTDQPSKRKAQLNADSSDDEDEPGLVVKKSSRLLRKQSHDEDNDAVESDFDEEDEAGAFDIHNEEEKDLEALLFGSKEPMMASIEKANRKKTSVKEEIGDSLETRKPAWEDPADQEM
jgi:hypothetical protein